MLIITQTIKILELIIQYLYITQYVCNYALFLNCSLKIFNKNIYVIEVLFLICIFYFIYSCINNFSNLNCSIFKMFENTNN